MTRRRDLGRWNAYANRQVALMDAAARCPLCKRLIVVAVFAVPGDGKHYCSAECLEIAKERAEHEEAQVHPVGCVCEACSAAYERDAWDPRMGPK